MTLHKDSQIVTIFSNELAGKEVNKNELKDANELIKEFASNPNPNNVYEIAQIMSFVINDAVEQETNYLETIADVKRTGINERADFQIEIDGLKAFFQAKSSTTERSRVSNKYFTLDTDEVSIRPVVNFLDLMQGKTDMVRLARQASVKMSNAIARRVQDATYSAFAAMGSPNYASGAGLVQGTFDPILHAMMRVADNVSIVGDHELLAEFTGLTGFGTVPEQLAIEHNRNGRIGVYKGANLVKLNNPLQANSLTQTELRKDLLYVIPSGDVELRPIKVQFAGGVTAITPDMNINSKEMEFRFDQYVGVGAIGVRKLLGIYEDTSI